LQHSPQFHNRANDRVIDAEPFNDATKRSVPMGRAQCEWHESIDVRRWQQHGYAEYPDFFVAPEAPGSVCSHAA
jgi:hypothetical protein